MKAFGFKKCLPVDHPEALFEIDLPKPTPTGRDILVKIEAVSVNPVDTKVRRFRPPPEGETKITGWDAAGTVEAIGEQVTLIKPGDRVWYAGAIDRPGSNSEFHLVDERIVSPKPQSLSFTEAAALPLTSITAWELLFDRFKFNANSTGALLVIGAAGGVGSILIQLAKALTQLTIIATASRDETIDWVHSLGADHIINHRKPLSEELKNIGFETVDFIASLTNTDDHFAEIVKAIAPQGKLALIDDPTSFDIAPFKLKSVSIHWELMFTRSLFKTPDMIEQRNLLAQVAEMVDAGKIRTTVADSMGAINAANLLRAHALLESGKSRGKIVLEGF